MSWQIGNEPRPFGEDNKKSFAAWIADCAALIKSMDSNHLVSIGSEGMAGCEGICHFGLLSMPMRMLIILRFIFGRIIGDGSIRKIFRVPSGRQ